MSKNLRDNLEVLALLFTVIADFILLFVGISDQREEADKEEADEILKQEVTELKAEIQKLKNKNSTKANS